MRSCTVGCFTFTAALSHLATLLLVSRGSSPALGVLGAPAFGVRRPRRANENDIYFCLSY